MENSYTSMKIPTQTSGNSQQLPWTSKKSQVSPGLPRSPRRALRGRVEIPQDGHGAATVALHGQGVVKGLELQEPDGFALRHAEEAPGFHGHTWRNIGLLGWYIMIIIVLWYSSSLSWYYDNHDIRVNVILV